MTRRSLTFMALLFGLGVSTLACGGPAPSSEPTTTPAVEEERPAASPPTPAPAPADDPVRSAMSTAGATRFDLVEGTRARYRVREQLVGVSFLNDAVGMTEALEGVLVIRPDGSVDASQSRLTLDLSTFSSDQDRRDGYLRRVVFEVEQHPMAVFVPTRTVGSPFPVPSEDPDVRVPIVGFQLIGDMTLHGVTTEITWNVLATYDDDGVVEGKALTSFSFSTFDLMTPNLAFLLTVEDEIRLEIDFNVKRLPE